MGLVFTQIVEGSKPIIAECTKMAFPASNVSVFCNLVCFCCKTYFQRIFYGCSRVLFFKQLFLPQISLTF